MTVSLTKPVNLGSEDNWGNILNDDLDTIEESLNNGLPSDGEQAISVAQSNSAITSAINTAQTITESYTDSAIAAEVARSNDAFFSLTDGQALQATSATTEELVAGAVLNTDGAISASVSWPIFIASFACQVVAASVIQWDGPTTISQDATNFWEVQINRERANVAALIADKATSTGSTAEAWSRRTDWNFDSVVFDATNSVLDKGDIVGVALVPHGTPTQQPSKVFAQIRYVPL